MAKRVRRWLAVGGLLGALAAPGFAAAADVALTIAPDVPAPLAERLQSAIAGQLADLQNDPPCQLTITRAGDALTLSFRDADGHARSERIVRGQSDELLASEASSMVRAFVIALQDEPVAAAPAPPEALAPEQTRAPVEITKPAPRVRLPAPTPRTATEPTPRDLLWLSALYTGSTYAPQLRWQSGVRVEASLQVLRRLRAGLSYGYHPTATVRAPLATIHVADHNASAFVGMHVRKGRFFVGGDVLFGATRSARDTTATDGAVVASGSSHRWSALLAVRARARVRVLEHAWLEFMPGLELPLGLSDAEIQGVPSQVLSPRSLRARLDVGGSFDLL